MSINEESIFAEAQEIQDPQARAAFLDSVCAGNPDLRKSVESLLSAYDAGQFLESPAPVLSATLEQPAVSEAPARQTVLTSRSKRSAKGALGWSTWPSSSNRFVEGSR